LSNKDIYRDFCRENESVPLFHQPWWLDIMTENLWDIAISFDKNHNVRAVMPYFIKNKYGQRILMQPALTPYLGILFFYPPDINRRTSIYSFQSKHTRALIDQIPPKLLYQYFNFIPQFDNWLPFYSNAYEQSVRYTYIIDNIKNTEKVFDGFTNTIKRQIKEAENKVKISYEDNLCLVFSMVKESLEKQKVDFGLNRDVLKALERKSFELNQAKVLIARDKNGNVSSGVFLVWDNHKAYLLGLGTSQMYGSNNSTKLLIWESIKYASKYVDTFDFEGSMLPGVERLYRSFGGVRTGYYEVKKYKNKYFKAIFALLNK